MKRFIKFLFITYMLLYTYVYIKYHKNGFTNFSKKILNIIVKYIAIAILMYLMKKSNKIY